LWLLLANQLSNSNFFTREELSSKIPYGDFPISALVSADSYDEKEILRTIVGLGNDAMILLQQCALQIAIIGAGKRSYGSIRTADDNVLSVVDVFKKYNVSYDNVQNSKLTKGELTPRRLVRFYRNCTHLFIVQNNRPSYLWLKYSDHNPKYIDICYPGAEHYVNTKDEYTYLCTVYSNVDRIMGTSFLVRLQRVGIARGLYELPSVGI